MAEPYLKSGQLVQVLSEYAAKGPPILVLFRSNRYLLQKYPSLSILSQTFFLSKKRIREMALPQDLMRLLNRSAQ
jgi:hypothetical protein